MINAKAARKAIQKGQVPADQEWYGGLAGLFGFFALWVSSGLYLFSNTSGIFPFLTLLLFLALGALFFYGLYNVLVERALTLVITGLSAAANRRLVQAAYTQLGWSLSQNSNHAVVANVPHTWYATYRAVCVSLPKDGEIHINVSNLGNARGRLPFFLSSNKQLLKLLTDTINQPDLRIWTTSTTPS